MSHTVKKERRRFAEKDNSQENLNRSVEQASAQTKARKLAKLGLRIGRTAVGKGVFATRRIVDCTCIGEIEGEVIFDDAYNSRYSFDLCDGAQLEPSPPFRYVNHSCEPNCAFELIGVSQTDGSNSGDAVRRLLLFAICDIEVGEELTIDYNWPASYAIPCHCKAPGCRGWIVDRTQLPRLIEHLVNSD